MTLLEFMYWTDVVMFGIIFCVIGISVLLYKAFKKTTPTNDDPTGEIKQQIFDKLNKIIEDIKSTV